ncbi:MAG: STAS domain-containing protein [Phycisphaerales bacterium]|nr:STAS domain-containing protein [Phycisphaerales bacterium]MCB9857716.1 STAS domain-containing protein [Phycisphaerales bacterium]
MFQSRTPTPTAAAPRTRAVTGDLIIQDYAGVIVATIGRPSLLDARDIERIGRDLCGLAVEQAKRKLVLDFTNVRQLSSQSIGMLMNVNRLVKDNDGTLAFCGVSDQIAKLFSLTKLDALFKIYRNDAAALAAFGVRVD